MHTSESLDDIKDDLELVFRQFMQGDYSNTSTATATIASKDFVSRFARYAEEYAYIQARRLVGKL